MCVNLYRCAAGTKPTNPPSSNATRSKFTIKVSARYIFINASTTERNISCSNYAPIEQHAMTFVAAFLLLTCVYFSDGAILTNCNRDDITFEKIVGLRPADNFHPLLLQENRNNSPITLDCLEKCAKNDECLSFVLYYRNSSCYWFRNEVHRLQEEESVLDSNAAWFSKTCLKERIKCDRGWTFERVPGATLLANNTKKLPQLLTRNQCQQYCLNETTFECRSAKFRVQPINAIAPSYFTVPPNKNMETLGLCILSNSDRSLSPNAYRVSGYDEEYFENLCSKRITNKFCAFEEFDGVELSHVDLARPNLTKIQCQDECNNIVDFQCKGYSLAPTNRASLQESHYNCLLHSENSKLHGPKSLRPHMGANYYERAPCLNIEVDCSPKIMTVKFTPDSSFRGRLYMKGYSENPECFVNGNYTQPVALKVPLATRKCGIVRADSPLNRTLLSSTMILQYNPSVQTQADRIIKVGCIFTNSTKLVIGAGLNFTEDHTSSGSNLVNTSIELPTVEMRILDLNTHGEVSDTQIGDELQLVIEMTPANRGIDIWASNLVAMTETGQEALTLLDERGCPTNLDIFPGLIKTTTNTSTTLTSNFQAFKFYNSNIIRFSVMVQFCMEICPPVDCGATYNRERRSVTYDGTSVVPINRTEFSDQAQKIVDRKPLEFIFFVRSADIRPDRLVYGENNRILVAGYDYLNNEVCVDYSLLLGIIITWVLIQIILLVSCIILIRKYKRFYENQCLNESLEELHKNFGLGFSNLEGNRRVHFADGHLT